MDNNNTYTEKLVRYLDGELSESESAALRTELDNNAEMQKEMNNLILTKDFIKNYGIIQKVSGIHQEMMKEMKMQKNTAKPPVKTLPKMIMRIAAGIILLVGLFGLYQYFTVSQGNLYIDRYEAYQVANMRGTSNANNIEKAYSKKKYDEVIGLY